MKKSTSALERAAQLPPLEIIYRPKDVRVLAGNVSLQCLWLWRKKGLIPEPIRLGPNTIGWPASVIRAWLASRPAA